MKILICDDDPIVRRALSTYLASDGITDVHEAADGLRGVDAALTGDFDLVLMDIAMPGRDGISATAQIVGERPGLPVVVLTSLGTEDQVSAAREAGAAEVHLKSASPEQIIATVRAAARRSRADRARIRAAASAGSRIAAGPEQAAVPHLSPRELEVLVHVCEARSNLQIAHRMGLAETTVKKHVAAIMAKLGASSRLDAVVRAMRAGIIEPPRPESDDGPSGHLGAPGMGRKRMVGGARRS